MIDRLRAGFNVIPLWNWAGPPVGTFSTPLESFLEGKRVPPLHVSIAVAPKVKRLAAKRVRAALEAHGPRRFVQAIINQFLKPARALGCVEFATRAS